MENPQSKTVTKKEPIRGSIYPQRRNDPYYCNSKKKFKNCCMTIYRNPSNIEIQTPKTETE